jgi:hypothetical protein
MTVERSLGQVEEMLSSSLVVLRLALGEVEGAVAFVVPWARMEGAGQMIGVLVRGRMLEHLREY